MDEIKKLRNFDNKRKNLAERIEHVEHVLDAVDVNKLIKENFNQDDYTYTNIEKYIEDLGTYLLESKDIESGRKIDSSFYRSDKYYNTSTSIGKNSLYIDTQEDQWVDHFNTLQSKSEELTEEYIFRLFDEDNLTLKEKRNLLKLGIPIIEGIENEHLKKELENFFENHINKSRNGTDLLVLNYFSKGLTDDEIADKLKVSRKAISKRFKKIAKN